MSDIDDAFVINNYKDIDITSAIKKYQNFKNASIPKEELIKYFHTFIQSKNEVPAMMFRKNGAENEIKQDFWILKFFDLAERNVDNIQYSSFTKDDLKEVINTCFLDNKIQTVKNYLLKKGIQLLFINALQGTKIDGATYLTKFNTIAIGLSGRFKRLDYIWFTLLHELSHVILHFDILKNGILSVESSKEKIELEANRLAKESIITPVKYRVCIPKRTLNKNDLIKCAKENNIHPALLAGLIRRDLNNYAAFSDIINKATLESEINYE